MSESSDPCSVPGITRMHYCAQLHGRFWRSRPWCYQHWTNTGVLGYICSSISVILNTQPYKMESHTIYLIVSGLFHWACSQGTSLCGICQVGFLTYPLMDTRSHAFVAIMLIWMWVGMKIYNFWNALISIFFFKNYQFYFIYFGTGEMTQSLSNIWLLFQRTQAQFSAPTW